MARPSKLETDSASSDGRPFSTNAGPDTRQMRQSRRTTAAVAEPAAEKPVALTVKVDQPRYEALKVLGARTRRSNREILLAALDAYVRSAEDVGASNVRPAGEHL